ncbi:hypothetical protein [Brevundimonas sp.]|uniref:hypothetical protein n=1 Tax=Brevundimonas sp. TaxID=1871086 RepID=UPI00289934E0|nr:hypothetical protein [Brevundimonas sp.]
MNDDATLSYVTQMTGELAKMLEKMKHPAAVELRRAEALLRTPKQKYEDENRDHIR